MKIAFVFIAEAYQVYHAAAVAFALKERAGIEVDFFHNDPEAPHHLGRIAAAHNAGPVSSQRLARDFSARLIQGTRVLGLAKKQVLACNETMLADYDAVVSTEDVVGTLFGGRNRADRPARILLTHGAGGRAVPSYADRPNCDFIVVKGPNDVERHLREGFARAGGIAAGGYPKLVTSRRLAASGPRLFAHKQETVLYNPHKVPDLQSWSRFIEPLLAGFGADPSRNLIVAPHIKMFRRRSERVRRRWRARSTDTVLIDPGSDRSHDNSYTEAADIYVGDVSSQVYEFVARPRPCVFLNPHRIDWRDDPHFLFWEMGEVIEDPSELMPALARAPRLHEHYRERQIEFAAAALGDTSPQCVERTADLIVEFVEKGRVEP